ncbi:MULTISPECIES: hypothetical protein [unclassified Streptomyces]|uniref:hypothetical protein n=1 Tax=unclassified Streptomyces TaxID=2593676 RepID=UPI002E29E5DF|nr:MULTISPECIES: hypothetical protein [unclassified Streptomyces]WUB88096.1 hypothetical protein OG812_16570 [Streptomyces sp. NBC_00566]
MKIVWFLWLARHLDEFGYDDGLWRAAVGTGAVLLTAALFGFVPGRHRLAAWAGAGLTCILGFGWLACH